MFIASLMRLMTTQRKAIVVGTGAGGLSAAAHLAKRGFEVIALDQADRVGGFLAPFTADGYTFDPGVHYVGHARRGQLFDSVLGELGIDVERAFVEMDPDGFDLYRFPDFEIRMCRGIERYRDRLIEHFPADRAGLHQFFDVVSRFGQVSKLLVPGSKRRLQDLLALRHLPSLLRLQNATFAHLLDEYVQNPKAKAVLAAACGDAGLPASKLSALVAIGLLDHYGDGAFFPRGGSGALRDALVESAQKNGAQFCTHADVAEILVRQGDVKGVRLVGGERLEADVVISNADPTVTFGKLLAADVVPRKLRSRVEEVQPSLATLIIFLGMRRDLRSYGLGAFNVWDYPTWDLDALYAPALAGQLSAERSYGFFLSSSTLRDDSNRLAPNGCSTLQIATFVPWEPFAAWANVPPEGRGEDYRKLRKELADRLLERVDRSWPGLIGDIAVQKVATPLSNNDYTRAVRGGIYGPAQTPEQMGRRRFSVRTPIRGLYLAGAGVYGAGVASCLASGLTAAALATKQKASVVYETGGGFWRGFQRLLHAR